MGDFADDMMFAALDHFDERDSLDPYEWMTNEGDVLDMRKMSTSHIINCIRMLERKGSNSRQLNELKEVLEERSRQSDATF